MTECQICWKRYCDDDYEELRAIYREQQREKLRWLTNGADASPPPQDVTLQQAYDHIAARLKAAQEPVAWSIELADGTLAEIGWLDMRLFESAKAIGTLAPGARYVFAYTATPALPEVTDEDVAAAWDVLLITTDSCAGGDMRKVLESYRARLMAKVAKC